MSLSATIVSMNEHLNLETLVSAHTVTIALPNGVSLELPVTKEQVQAIIAAKANAKTPPAHLRPAPSPVVATAVATAFQAALPPPPPAELTEDEGGVVFGGDGDDDPQAASPWPPPEPPMEAAAPPPVSLPQPPPAPRTRVVNDGNGYPVVVGGEDPRSVIQRSDDATADEDGVASI